MQAYTFALLLAGVSANSLLDSCNSAAGAAGDFGSAIKSGAMQRGGHFDFKKHYESFCGQLDTFHNNFQNCNQNDFNDDFSDKFCDFENNVADCLDHLNNFGNDCGGFDIVWEWSNTIWGKWNDICDQFGDKGDCKHIDHIFPHHKHVEDCFFTLSHGWDFGGHDCTFPSRDPWHHHSTCEAVTSSYPATTTPPVTKTSAVSTSSASSTKVAPTTSKAEPSSSSSATVKPTTSKAEPSSSSSSSEKPATTGNTVPGNTDTRPVSTYTGSSTTYRCHVNGAAVTGANA